MQILKRIKNFSIQLVALMIVWGVLVSTLKAQERCNTDCVKIVKSLLKETTYGISSSFGEKNNARLGDKVSIALLKIFNKGAIYKPKNIRQFLPVIRAAFESPELISQAEDKQPIVTISLLKKVRKKVKDRYLKTQITQTINIILSPTSEIELKPPPNKSLSVSAKQIFS